MTGAYAANGSLQDQFDILVTKSGNVDDLILGLIKKAKIASEEEAGRIRVFEVSNHKLFRELERSQAIITVNEYTNVVAERVPEEEEERDVDESSQFINCFHFQLEPSRTHGMPFKFLMKPVRFLSITGQT